MIQIEFDIYVNVYNNTGVINGRRNDLKEGSILLCGCLEICDKILA